MSAFGVHVDLRGTRAVCGVLFSTLMVGTAFGQQPSRELGSLINEYRSESRTCQGRQMDAAGPLAPDEILSNVRFNSSSQLRDALRELGYLPAQVQAIRLTGAPSDGDNWRVVLARPVLSPDLGDWSEAGRKILRLTNEARVEHRTCGGQAFDAAPPLAWAPELAAASHCANVMNRKFVDMGAAYAVDDESDRTIYWTQVFGTPR